MFSIFRTVDKLTEQVYKLTDIIYGIEYCNTDYSPSKGIFERLSNLEHGEGNLQSMVVAKFDKADHELLELRRNNKLLSDKIQKLTAIVAELTDYTYSEEE